MSGISGVLEMMTASGVSFALEALTKVSIILLAASAHRLLPQFSEVTQSSLASGRPPQQALLLPETPW